MNYEKLISESTDNNIRDMYNTFSYILAEKIVGGIDARRSNIASSLLEKCGCIDCKCAEKKKITCPKCDGEGCDHCDGKGYHLDEAFTKSSTGGRHEPDRKKRYALKNKLKRLGSKEKNLLAKALNSITYKGVGDGPGDRPEEIHGKASAKNIEYWTPDAVRRAIAFMSKKKMVGADSLRKSLLESVQLDEKSFRDFDVPASPEIKKHIESGKAKILKKVTSVLGPTTKFVVIERPKMSMGSGKQDKVIMATISDPKRGRIKMFAFHGSHVSLAKAMQFAINNKLVTTTKMESFELDEAGIFAKPRSKYLALAKEKLKKGGGRQLKDKKKEAMVVDKKGKVIVIDRKDIRKYTSKGWQLAESVINQLQKSHTSKMPVDININGNIIHVTPDVSENLINLHDELNEENQTKMREMLKSDTSSFVKLARFAQEK